MTSTGKFEDGLDEDEGEEEEQFTFDMYNAVEKNDISKLEEILRTGVSPDGFSDLHCRACGKSILHVAVEKGRLDCANMLIDYGADICMKDEWGISVFMYSIIDQYPEVAEMLLQRDPEAVDMQNKSGKAALHCAVEAGNVDLVKLILDNGGDVNIHDYFGITPLMRLGDLTDIDCHVEIAEILIERGALVNLRDFRSKMSALQYAVSKKQVGLVQTLLEADADPNTEDAANRTPITNLIWSNVRITESKPEVDPDVMAIAVFLVQKGANINNSRCEYSNPLIMASFMKAEPLIRFFLDFGSDPNIKFVSGAHPLLVAVMKRHLPSVRALLDWNCKIDMKGRVALKYHEDCYLDPMELAIALSCWDIVNVLIGAGYNLSKLEYLRDVHSGCEVPKPLLDNPEMYSYLQNLACTCDSLYHLTTVAIWRSISQNITAKTDLLPLPPRIRKDISPNVCLMV